MPSIQNHTTLREAPLNRNMDIMQPSVLSEARFKLKRTELQIFIILVAAAQEDLRAMLAEGIRKGVSEYRPPEIDGDVLVRFSLNDFPIDMDGNELRLLSAARSLVKQTIEVHTDSGWVIEPLLSKVEYVKADRSVMMTVRPSVWKRFLDIRLGYTEYELFVAMALKSVYSVRFYMLACTDTKPREYTIAELKKQFDIEKKYTQVSDLFKNVINPAKAELDLKAPMTFEVTPKKRQGSKEVTGIVFAPKRNRAKRDETLEEKKLMHGKVQVGMSLDSAETKWLREKLLFSPSELNANFGTFNTAKKIYGDGLMDAMIGIYETILRKDIKNRKGYFVSSLRNNIAIRRTDDVDEQPQAPAVQGELFPENGGGND